MNWFYDSIEWLYFNESGEHKNELHFQYINNQIWFKIV